MFKRKLPDLEFDSEITLERYEYIFDTVTEANNFVLPKDEDVISFSIWPEDNKVHLKVKSPKIIPRSNFISKIRELSKNSLQLDFTQKYPQIAEEIKRVAKCGDTCCWINLKDMPLHLKSDLVNEGFKIISEGTNIILISWEENC